MKPKLSHLQSLIIALLGSVESSGEVVRSRLKKHGHPMSGPAFYQVMARLEKAKFVFGYYTPSGSGYKTKSYRATKSGISALKQTISIYAKML